MTTVKAIDQSGQFAPGRLLDPGALGRLAADVGATSLGALLEAFRRELQRREAPLRSAIDACDLPEIASATHAIKGSALTFGALALGEASARANALAREGELAALAAAEQTLNLIEPTLAEVSRQATERRA